MLTVAASYDAGGSSLRRRGKLAVTRQEAGVSEGGLAAMDIKTQQINAYRCRSRRRGRLLAAASWEAGCEEA